MHQKFVRIIKAAVVNLLSENTSGRKIFKVGMIASVLFRGSLEERHMGFRDVPQFIWVSVSH